MKVKYLTQYTDEFGFTYKAGWTAEHTDAHAQRLIDDGTCERVADNVRPTRHASADTHVLDQCIVPAQQESELSGNSELLEELDRFDEPGEMPPLRTNFFGASGKK